MRGELATQPRRHELSVVYSIISSHLVQENCYQLFKTQVEGLICKWLSEEAGRQLQNEVVSQGLRNIVYCPAMVLPWDEAVMLINYCYTNLLTWPKAPR